MGNFSISKIVENVSEDPTVSVDEKVPIPVINSFFLASEQPAQIRPRKPLSKRDQCCGIALTSNIEINYLRRNQILLVELKNPQFSLDFSFFLLKDVHLHSYKLFADVSGQKVDC